MRILFKIRQLLENIKRFFRGMKSPLELFFWLVASAVIILLLLFVLSLFSLLCIFFYLVARLILNNLISCFTCIVIMGLLPIPLTI